MICLSSLSSHLRWQRALERLRRRKLSGEGSEAAWPFRFSNLHSSSTPGLRAGAAGPNRPIAAMPRGNQTVLAYPSHVPDALRQGLLLLAPGTPSNVLVRWHRVIFGQPVRRSRRGKLSQTRNRHLRNHCGFPVAFANGLSVTCSNIFSCVSGISQRIVTCSVVFTGNVQRTFSGISNGISLL